MDVFFDLFICFLSPIRVTSTNVAVVLVLSTPVLAFKFTSTNGYNYLLRLSDGSDVEVGRSFLAISVRDSDEPVASGPAPAKPIVPVHRESPTGM